MEKSRNFQIHVVYAGRMHKPFKTNQLTTRRHYETGDSPAATLSHWGQASSRKQSEYGRHGLSNILKLQATFLYAIYHQRPCKTNLFHMTGGRFHAGNTLYTFTSLFAIVSLHNGTITVTFTETKNYRNKFINSVLYSRRSYFPLLEWCSWKEVLRPMWIFSCSYCAIRVLVSCSQSLKSDKPFSSYLGLEIYVGIVEITFISLSLSLSGGGGRPGREHTVITYSVRWWWLYLINENRRKPTTGRQQ